MASERSQPTRLSDAALEALIMQLPLDFGSEYARQFTQIAYELFLRFKEIRDAK